MTRSTMLSFAVITAILAGGCAPKSPSGSKPPGSPPGSAKKHDDHEHGPGPHGGTVFDLGKYHAEFKVDHGKQEATIYILGDDEKTPTPIEAAQIDVTIKTPAFSVELKPVPMEGESGKSSRFVAKHENFGKEQEFEGTATMKSAPSRWKAKFKEEPEPKK